MEKDNIFYLQHILEAIGEIQNFTSKMDENKFLEDRRTQLAVIKCIEIIGEATKKISMDFRSTAPSIPWKKMAAMRDVLIHNYMDVNYKEVWQVVEKDIDFLQTEISKLL